MALPIAPTKANLQRSRRGLRVAADGYELLDRKRTVLLRELMAVIEDARKAQGVAAAALARAFEALRNANITLGAEAVSQVARGCPEALPLKVLDKSVMGAWIPSISLPPAAATQAYSFRHTGAALDDAVAEFRRAAEATARAAALENTVICLAQEIQSTQKRANALHHVLIPRYEEQVKFIAEALEEREREEFFKVKQVKRKKQGDKQWTS